MKSFDACQVPSGSARRLLDRASIITPRCVLPQLRDDLLQW
jgi:hypothetical protein